MTAPTNPLTDAELTERVATAFTQARIGQQFPFPDVEEARVIGHAVSRVLAQARRAGVLERQLVDAVRRNDSWRELVAEREDQLRNALFQRDALQVEVEALRGAVEAGARIFRAWDKLADHIRPPKVRSEAGIHNGRDDVRVVPTHRLKTFIGVIEKVRALSQPSAAREGRSALGEEGEAGK